MFSSIIEADYRFVFGFLLVLLIGLSFGALLCAWLAGRGPKE